MHLARQGNTIKVLIKNGIYQKFLPLPWQKKSSDGCNPIPQRDVIPLHTPPRLPILPALGLIFHSELPHKVPSSRTFPRRLKAPQPIISIIWGH